MEKYRKTFMDRAVNTYAAFKADIVVFALLAAVFAIGFGFGALVVWVF